MTKKKASRNTKNNTSKKNPSTTPKDEPSLVPELFEGHSIVGNDASFDYHAISNKLNDNKDPKHQIEPTNHEKKQFKMLNQLLEHLQQYPEIFSKVTF